MASRVLNIPLGKLKDSPYQGRLFDKKVIEKSFYTRKKLNELAESIKSAGLMQPITVRIVDDGYEVIDGHRRIEAYKLLEKGNIQAIVKEGTDKEVQLMSVVANIQRADLSNLERALAFEKILHEGLFTNKKELSKAIGKDETYVGDIINILKMDKRIITDLSKGNRLNDLRMLRMIRNVEDVDENGKSEKQHKLYLKCITQKLTRQQLKASLEKKNSKSEVEKVNFTLNESKYGFLVRFNGKVDKKKKQQVKELIEKQIGELLRE